MLLSPLYTRKNKINSLIIIIALFIFLTPANAQTYNPQVTKYQTKQSYEKYPAIDNIEQKVFGQVSTSRNIYERLNALESKVFKKTYNIELSQRVENLQNAIGNKNNTLETNNIAKRLVEIENHLFQQAYQNDSLNSRLARIEGHYFGQTYSDESPKSRTDRIYTVMQVEVYKANNSSVPNDVINKTSDGMKVLSIIMFVTGLFL